MLNRKKCSACRKKISKKFNYCPWCATPVAYDNDDFGMLGNADYEKQEAPDLKLPFGLNGIFNTLVKQIEKELSGMEPGRPPKGFKIQISTKPKLQQMDDNRKVQTISSGEVDEKERERRAKLGRIEAKSNVRRLPEGLVYEIEAPGVKSVSDVVITKLEESIEVKIYTSNSCFVKNINLKTEVSGYSVKGDKVLLKLKG